MKKQGTEFYIGLSIWLLELPISYGLWFTSDDVGMMPSLSTFNIVLSAVFFLLYLAGYLASHGCFQFLSNRKIVISGLLLSSAATISLSTFFFFGMVALMATMIIIQLVQFIERRWALFIAISVPALLVVLDVLLGKSFEFTNIVVYGIFNLLAVFTSYGLSAERRAKRELEQVVRELTATQILLSATTKRDERLRIARDLHDSLGHQLTALSLQLEVASHVDNDKKLLHIQQAKAISSSLLSDVRDIVSEIRQKKDLELRDALTTLVQGIPDLKVDLNLDLDESLTDARQAEVIFRCVQEAITNIAKHAFASHCRVGLADNEQHLILTIEDNGVSTADIIPGNGLTGMAERVAKVDGQLSYQKTARGFSLTVRLPKHKPV